MKYLNKEDKKTREMVNKYFGIKVRIIKIKSTIIIYNIFMTNGVGYT